MSKKGYLIVSIGLTLFFVATMCLVSQNVAMAQECRIIRIHGGPGNQTAVRVEPNNMWVTPGTCVVWMNQSRLKEVKVIFKEGKVCHDVTSAPSGFKLDEKNCYVTNYIEHGGTSSLMFNQEGTFDFTVQGGGENIKGSILVRKLKK